MTPETKALIDKKKSYAKAFVDKAIAIAKALGIEHPKNHGSWFKYNKDNISIEWDNYGANLIVKYNNITVLGTHLGEIDYYRDDIREWSEIIISLYSKLPPKIDNSIAEEKKHLLDHWGIKQ